MDVISKEAEAQSGTEPGLRNLVSQFGLLRQYGARLGPYVLLEMLLPGGTLLALLLFLYQRRKQNGASRPMPLRLASPAALVSTLGRGLLALQPAGKS